MHALTQPRAVPDAPGRDETAAGFLRRISGASPDPLEAKREALAEAEKHRDYYSNLARETRDMADECETAQGRTATINHAMRLKGQALTWASRVTELAAEIEADESQLKGAPAQVAAVEFKAGQVEGMDETMSFAGVVL